MGLIPAKCWAFFLFSLSFSNISLIRSLNVLQARLLSLPKNGNFTAQLRVKQAKYANEYFCTLWLNGCGKKALNRCRWSKKGCLRAFREDQRKESTNELKKLFKKWKTSGKHSMNEWMNEWLFPSSYEHQNRGMAHQNIPTYSEDSDWLSKVLIIEQLRRNQAIIDSE